MVHKEDGVLNGHDMVRVETLLSEKKEQDEIDFELRRLELIVILEQNKSGLLKYPETWSPLRMKSDIITE